MVIFKDFKLAMTARERDFPPQLAEELHYSVVGGGGAKLYSFKRVMPTYKANYFSIKWPLHPLTVS